MIERSVEVEVACSVEEVYLNLSRRLPLDHRLRGG